MFAWGVCIGTEAKYEQFAKPSVARAEANHVLVEKRHQSSIFEAYNAILDAVSDLPELEGLILLHEDIELREHVENTLRVEFAQPEVAIVGAIGGRGPRSVRWSKASETFGRAPDGFYGENDHGGGFHDVDTVDGLFLAMSPWAVRNLRFDERTYTGFHAYDADICMQARASGRRVRVVPIDLFHHTKGGFGNTAQHRIADDAFRRKWSIPLDPLSYRLGRRIRNLQY